MPKTRILKAYTTPKGRLLLVRIRRTTYSLESYIYAIFLNGELLTEVYSIDDALDYLKWRFNIISKEK